MIKPGKQQIVDQLILLIEKGKSYSVCLGVNRSKWKFAESTFARYWKIANQQHAERQQSLNKAKADLDFQNAVDERKKQIADINERKEILTKIIRGQMPLKKAFVTSKGIKYVNVVPDWMDRKNAIAELNKMDGSYEAEKLDVTTTGIPSSTITLADGTVITL